MVNEKQRRINASTKRTAQRTYYKALESREKQPGDFDWVKKSGVKASCHTLRHSHIVHALLNKVPITAIQKQVGHKRLTTTQIYSDFAPEQMREAYEQRR